MTKMSNTTCMESMRTLISFALPDLGLRCLAMFHSNEDIQKFVNYLYCRFTNLIVNQMDYRSA